MQNLIDVNICTPANGAYWLAGDLLIILMHQYAHTDNISC